MKKGASMEKPPEEEHKTRKIADLLRAAGIKRQDVLTLKLSELHIDARYQRVVRPAKVSRMLQKFNPGVCGTLIISKRNDGCYYVIDGQHRLSALRKLGLTHWNCNVFTGLSAEDEAEIWELYNTQRTRPKAIEVFKERLFRREPTAVEIEDTLTKNGFSLYLHSGKTASNRKINAVGALDRIYKDSGVVGLELILKIIQGTWEADEPHVNDGVVLWGLHVFVTHKPWVGKWTLKKLTDKLAEIPIRKLLREVRAAQETFGGQPAWVFARMVAKIYNKGLKNGRLPVDWEKI